MNIQNWVLFDKAGSQMNWTPDTLLPLSFASEFGKNATGYLITDSSGNARTAEITNGGYLYDTDTSVYYTYALDSFGTIKIPDASVSYASANIFGSKYDSSNGSNINITKSISSVSNISIGPDPSITIEFGALYNWYAVVDSRNLAPSGWRVPTLGDWDIAIAYSGGPNAGAAMKETGYTYWNSPNTGATNATKLNLRGGGIRGQTFGDFFNIKLISGYWTTDTEYGNTGKWKGAEYNRTDLGQSGSGYRRGLSVRLLKNTTNLTNGQSGTMIGNDGHVYRTICIGTQEWLAEDLIETKYRNGDWIAGYNAGVYTPFSDGAWASLNIGAMCYYNNNVSNAYTITYLPETSFVYPSATYAAAVFLKPVSVGLVESEHIFIFENQLNNYIRPIDTSNNILVFQMDGDDAEIQFFQVDESTTEITWTDELAFDVSAYAINQPIQLNVGFRSEFEGVFERTIRVYHVVGNILYELANIVVSAEAVGEDERFRTLLTNFGLPDPKDMKEVFKETNINEDRPDWDILNYKSKHMILEHDKIMPFVGTYKGLINAIKWLGYDDIKVREWFLNVKENRKINFIVPFDAKDRTQTLLMFNADQRKSFKKLNQLTLEYCLTRDTGEIDDWGTPITENCYSYNIKEIFVKLMGLKKWLEANIIGVNCRITDINGDGVYYERIQNLIYATDNIGYEYNIIQPLTPYATNERTELVTGRAEVDLTFLELERTTIDNLKYRFIDMADSAWNPNDPSVYYSLSDPSYLADPSSFLLVGATFQYPFVHIQDVMYRMSVEKPFAGVIGQEFVTNPLFILENDIRFYNIFDSSSYFHCVSTNCTVLLEQAYLRDASNDVWDESIAWHIYVDPSQNHDYVMESSTGVKLYFDGYATFTSDATSVLKYVVDDNYKVPMLSFKNFKFIDSTGAVLDFGGKEYYLDILDGKIYMDGGTPNTTIGNLALYLNWNYDAPVYVDMTDSSNLTTSLSEQRITVNAVYDSPRTDLWMVDPSVYYWADPSVLTGNNHPNIMLLDNSTCTMKVNHIGDYVIELFVWDSYNTMLNNRAKDTHEVYIKYPTIYTLINEECNNVCSTDYLTLTEVSSLLATQPTPIYDRIVPMQGLTVEIDGSGYPYIVIPFISYFQDVPEPNSINKFYNLTERVLDVSTNFLVIDPDFQKFYNGDTIAVVQFDKGKYSIAKEVNKTITSVVNVPTGLKLNGTGIGLGTTLDASNDLYVINTTLRDVSTITNNVDNTFSAFVLNYNFEIGQNVAIIAEHYNGYSWGATYRVLDVSTISGFHKFDGLFPAHFFALDSSSDPIYSVKAKHAFTTYAEMQMNTYDAQEVLGVNGNEFDIYLSDSRCQEYYLDDTFVMINILFDHDIVNKQWYTNTTDSALVASPFYYHIKPISVDTSTLVILQAKYPVYDNITVWKNNYGYETFSTNNLDIISAVNSDSSMAAIGTTSFEVAAGDEFLFDFDMSCGGALPAISLIDYSGFFSNAPTVVNGRSRVSVTAARDSSAAWFLIYTTGITNYSLKTYSLQKEYLLDQKNIWQVTNHDTSTILFKVFNETAPYIYNEVGKYNVECTSYDVYGNAITKLYEGLIEVIDPTA